MKIHSSVIILLTLCISFCSIDNGYAQQHSKVGKRLSFVGTIVSWHLAVGATVNGPEGTGGIEFILAEHRDKLFHVNYSDAEKWKLITNYTGFSWKWTSKDWKVRFKTTVETGKIYGSDGVDYHIYEVVGFEKIR